MVAGCMNLTTGNLYYEGVVKFSNSFKIYRNETLIRNLLPCYYHGEYGLWDIINNKFYGNSGTGTITGEFN